MTFPDTFHQLNEPQFTSFRAPSQTSIDGRPGSRASSIGSAHTTLTLAPTASSARPLNVVHSSDRLVDAQEKILCLAWGTDLCADLLAFGTDSGVTVLRIKIRDEESTEDEDQDIITHIEVEELASFHLPSACLKLSWSYRSVSNVQSGDVAIRLACACADHTIRIVSNEPDAGDILFGHRDFINSLSFDPHLNSGNGELFGDAVVPNERLVSASDDLTFRVWNLGQTDDKTFSVYYTSSECTNVQFHPQRNNWILVGCADGAISIFNAQTEEYLMQLSLGIKLLSPLKSLDWCLLDFEKVCALVGSQYFTWRLSLGKTMILPQVTGELKSLKGGNTIRYGLNSDIVAITLNEPKSARVSSRQTFAVYLYKSQYTAAPISALIPPASLGTAPIDDISWTVLTDQQYEKSVLAGCLNQKICFWTL